MIQVKIKTIPLGWLEDESSHIQTEIKKIVGEEYMASVKSGYVTLSSGDNIPMDHVEFLYDIDGSLTKEEFLELSQG
jgi:hypothetical protein